MELERRRSQVVSERFPATVKNVIAMDEHFAKVGSRPLSLRDRRYAIRYPFAADAEFLDLETGARTSGITSDISLGGCFVCASKPLQLNTRVRITLSRKDQKMEALAVVRIVKPRVGMGIEFIDVDTKSHIVLERWIDQLRRSH
jgi:PilZ domain